MKSYNVTIQPGPLSGSIDIPPAKSMLHRALIAAALSRGESMIEPIILSDDVLATINAIKGIGAQVTIENNRAFVRGIKTIKRQEKIIDVYDSGSTLRFMIPIASLASRSITFNVRESLRQRPLTIYNHIFKDDLIQDGHHITINGTLEPGDYTIDGTLSSQFISGLMFTLPLLKAPSKLYVTNPSSKMYIDLTIETLEAFNIEIQDTDYGYYIKGNQTYKPTNFNVHGDFSQAAFFLTAGLTNKNIRVRNLDIDSFQADKAFIDIVKKMNGKFLNQEDGYSSVFSHLNGATIDLDACPDLGPVLALLATQAKGTTKLINAKRLRYKESDRIVSTVKTLSALGANIDNTEDSIIIHGKTALKGGVTLDSYHDHRIVMMASIAATFCKFPVTIRDAHFVEKSYPHFFKDLKSLGAEITYEEVLHDNT